ncbi:MAG TPA: class I SAM-dependent methyltransferase [Mycobacteriales bacterium]|nr:class I SAM-dependent methyltransferase [Mycobacteriales bacterium]
MTEAPRHDSGVVALNHDARETYDRALRQAREAAFARDEFVGQESFMPASDILRLAEHAGITAHSTVLDVCCGVGGPGLLLARRFGCRYHGIDASAAAVRIARARAGDLDCRFDVHKVPPLPIGRYDIVVLLETLLAFENKDGLLRAAYDALPAGGRFAFTVEVGRSLSAAERNLMPEPDTVWPVPMVELLSQLDSVGFQVTWQEDCSATHAAMARRLYDEFVADADDIVQQIGRTAHDSLLTSHRLWADWLETGRVRKLAVVAAKVPELRPNQPAGPTVVS